MYERERERMYDREREKERLYEIEKIYMVYFFTFFPLTV